MAKTLEYAFDCIVWYDCHYYWLEQLADELEKTDFYAPSFPIDKWYSEEHTKWMLLVGMFGDWGVSIRSGWITETKEAAQYIRNILDRLKE